MSNDPDRDDMLAFQTGGDRASLAALWQRHADDAWRLARWICGERAEDALQEAALQLVRAAPRWRDRESGSTVNWLMTIVANAARKERRRGRRGWLPLGVVGELPAQDHDDQDQERQERVRQALGRLTTRHRQPVELRYLAGLEFPAVAAALGVPERTARTRVSRGLTRLRELLGVPATAGTAGVVLLLTPNALPAAPAAVGGLVTQVPAGVVGVGASTVALAGGAALALKAGAVVLLAAGAVGAWQVARMPAPPPPAAAAEAAADPAPAVDVSLTPHGWSAEKAFADLRRKGGPRVECLGVRGTLLVPTELRFKPVAGRKLIDAVAAAQGLRIAWFQAGTAAVLYPGAAEADLNHLRLGVASKDPAIRAEAAWCGGWLADPQVIPLLVQATRDADVGVAQQARISLRRWGSWPAVATIDPTAVDVIVHELAVTRQRGPVVQALGCLGKDVALPLIRKILLQPDGLVDWDAARALGQVGGEAELLTLIDKALADPDGTVRRAAALALSSLDGDMALPLIKKALTDPDAGVRWKATEALGNLSAATALPLIEALTAEDAVEAMEALGNVGGDQAFALITKNLVNRRARVRQKATTALGGVGGGRELALLEKALATPDAEPHGAFVALVRIGGDAVLPLLEKALSDREPSVREQTGHGGMFGRSTVREQALVALSRVGGDKELTRFGKELIPCSLWRSTFTLDDHGSTLDRMDGAKRLALISTELANPDSRIREQAARQLCYLGGIPALALAEKALADREIRVRMSALYALGVMGGDRALISIERSFTDQDPLVRQEAVNALGNVGGDKALALLEQTFRHPDAKLRECAAQMLYKMDLDKALPAISRALANPDASVRRGAAYALRSVSFYGFGDMALPLIEKALVDQDIRVRQMAISSLANVSGNKALPFLDKALSDPDVEIRRCAALSLNGLSKDNMLPLLAKGRRDQDAQVRQNAARRLEEYTHRYGTLHLDQTRELIEKALADPDEHVRHDAAGALYGLDSATVLALIEAPLADPVDRVRSKAAQSLSHLPRVKVLEIIDKALKDPRSPLRPGAAVALGFLEDGDDIFARIETALTDPDSKVRLGAVQAVEYQEAEPTQDLKDLFLRQLRIEQDRDVHNKMITILKRRFPTDPAVAKILAEDKNWRPAPPPPDAGAQGF